MKRNVKFLVAIAAASIWGNAARGSALVDLTILGNTDGGTNYSNSVTVSPDEVVHFEVLGSMAGLNSSNGTNTITSLVFGTDGIINLPFNLIDNSAANIPITGFASVAFANNDNGTGSSVGTYSSNNLNGVKIVADTSNNHSPLGVVANNTPGNQVLLTGTFTTGDVVTGTSTLGESFPAGSSGSFDINNGSTIFYSTAAGDTQNTSFAPLTLNAASASPEPGSLSLLAMASAGLLASRRRRRST